MPEQILIVGAGASGLYAGKVLLEKGFEVTVLEARSRLGGRIFTMDAGFSAPVDLGAEFIHGKQKLTRKLLSEAGLVSRSLEGEWKQVRGGQMDQENNGWQAMMDRMDSLKEDLDLFSFLETYYNKPEDADLRESVTRFVEGYDAADSHRVSVFALREEWKGQDDEEQAQIEGGYGALIAFLAEKIAAEKGRIELNYPVKEIRWQRGRVTAIASDGREESGGKILVTSPISVLQNDTLKFVPSLPFEPNVFENFGIGGVIKFIYEFNTPFWKHCRNNRLRNACFFTSDAEIPTWWTSAVTDKPLLVGWLAGPTTFRRQNDKALLNEEALRSLAYIFDTPKEKVASEMVNHFITDWMNDPWARGAYAYGVVKTPDARKKLLTPVEGSIFFAGEALYDGPAMGTVEAAFESARAAVERICGNI
jgi:monoamine oxidase